MVENLQKARKRWAWFSRITGQYGADPWTDGTFYKAVVQVTLLFGADTWVMSPRIGKTLGGFHHRVFHWLVLMRPRQDIAPRWFHPPLDAVMASVGLEEVDMYVLRCQNTVA